MTLDGIVHWFETLTRDTAREIGRYYAPEAFFKDPFNEVTGSAAIGRILAHMFEQVDEPRFRILERWEAPHGAMLTWEFRFRFRGGERLLVAHGATHLRFAPDGRIAYHRDFWDTAEELYAKLPVIGALMRFLQRRGRA
jgi:hypothetical protein